MLGHDMLKPTIVLVGSLMLLPFATVAAGPAQDVGDLLIRPQEEDIQTEQIGDAFVKLTTGWVGGHNTNGASIFLATSTHKAETGTAFWDVEWPRVTEHGHGTIVGVYEKEWTDPLEKGECFTAFMVATRNTITDDYAEVSGSLCHH